MSRLNTLINLYSAFKMYTTFLFLFAVVFCVGIKVTSSKELNENDIARSERENLKFISVNITDVKKLNLQKLYANGSELEAAPENDCRCKNGKCMRKCDIEKTIPCLDETMECVCDPEYAKTYPSQCEYCNCGYGFNCTFQIYMYYWRRNCICPKGYRIDKNTGNCTEVCSKEYPCKNGGTCSNQECICPYGTNGAFCEEILDCSDCGNSPEVECLYDQNLKKSYCSCKNFTLFYDYDKMKCITCPCRGGNCIYKNTFFGKKLRCDCFSGYKEFNGYCKECSCGYGGKCELDYKGKKICNCEDGFFEREGRCWSCRCMQYSDVTTKCEVTGTKKRCFCKEGYQDVLGHCEDIDECEVNNSCHPSVKCYNTEGSFECRCRSGYLGSDGRKIVKPGEVCEDINECYSMSSLCFSSANCVNLPGSYKCECKRGYQPYKYDVQPDRTLCEPTTKSWVPALIVLFVSAALFILLACMHNHLKKRAGS